MAHLIEVAKSGRAACRTCKEKIANGELRFGEEFKNPFSDDGGMSHRWHHLPCAAKKLPHELKATLETFDGTVPDRAALDKAIEEAAGKVKAKAKFPYLDRAPTNRAHCISCEEVIEKGRVRAVIEREVSTGTFVTKGPGYLHVACAKAFLDERGDDTEELASEFLANTTALPADEAKQAIAEL